MSSTQKRQDPPSPISDAWIIAEIAVFKAHADSGMYHRKQLSVFFRHLKTYIEQPMREVKVVGVEPRPGLRQIQPPAQGMKVMEALDVLDPAGRRVTGTEVNQALLEKLTRHPKHPEHPPQVPHGPS